MNWIKIVRENEKKIKNELRKANWYALNNHNMCFVVNMDYDGYVWIDGDIAGGNSYSALVFNGLAIVIASYCYQYDECNPSLEQKAFKESLNEIFEIYVEYLDDDEDDYR